MRYRRLLGIALAAGALAAGVAVALRWQERPPSPAAQPDSAQPVVSITRPVVKHTEGERLAWQLRLKQIQITQGAGNLAAEGLQEALIYGASGRPLVRVTAQKVTGSTTGSDFSVTGQVTVVSYQGMVLSTNTVEWKQSQGLIQCPGVVTARGREVQVSTTGMVYDLNKSLLTAPGQVNLYSGPNQIAGRGLRYNVDTGNYQVDHVQMVFQAEAAQRAMQGAGR